MRLGPGLAYSPAVTLAYGESLTTNFGAIPLRYLVEGYQPLEAILLLNIWKANLMLDWLFTLDPFRISTDTSLAAIELTHSANKYTLWHGHIFCLLIYHLQYLIYIQYQNIVIYTLLLPYTLSSINQ